MTTDTDGPRWRRNLSTMRPLSKFAVCAVVLTAVASSCGDSGSTRSTRSAGGDGGTGTVQPINTYGQTIAGADSALALTDGENGARQLIRITAEGPTRLSDPADRVVTDPNSQLISAAQGADGTWAALIAECVTDSGSPCGTVRFVRISSDSEVVQTLELGTFERPVEINAITTSGEAVISTVGATETRVGTIAAKVNPSDSGGIDWIWTSPGYDIAALRAQANAAQVSAAQTDTGTTATGQTDTGKTDTGETETTQDASATLGPSTTLCAVGSTVFGVFTQGSTRAAWDIDLASQNRESHHLPDEMANELGSSFGCSNESIVSIRQNDDATSVERRESTIGLDAVPHPTQWEMLATARPGNALGAEVLASGAVLTTEFLDSSYDAGAEYSRSEPTEPIAPPLNVTIRLHRTGSSRPVVVFDGPSRGHPLVLADGTLIGWDQGTSVSMVEG